jgi:glutamate synthase domain-containing protein 3
LEIDRPVAGPLALDLHGAAGQSFGAFLAEGIELVLVGQANDYVGKGLSGGRIVIRPEREVAADPAASTIAGNVCLFGATAGRLHVVGRAGMRFAIRNSGAEAVVEGIGPHGCEYMTGGTVVILGRTGRNFAAGMSGGVAYVLDEHDIFSQRCNMELVGFDEISPLDAKELRGLVAEHARLTGSTVAGRVLEEWELMLPKFKKVMPHDYKRALTETARERAGETAETDAIDPEELVR